VGHRAQPEAASAESRILRNRASDTEGNRNMQLALTILRMYKRWISPMLPRACRFYPTCSEYMLDAIEKHGLLRGAGLGLRRLSRCHPFHAGGFDPVR
jgi:putative membrane protein insertion efficiency factor